MPQLRGEWPRGQARLLDGFELREGPHGPVPFLGGAELEVRLYDNAG